MQAASAAFAEDVTDGQAGAAAEAEPTEGPKTPDARGKGLGPRRASEPQPGAGEGRPQVLPPRPDRAYAPVNSEPPAAAQDETPPYSAGRTTVAAVRRAANGVEDAAFVAGPVQPALLIGLGGIGVRTLGQLRRRLTLELGRADELPYVRLLGVDSDPDALQAAGAAEPGQALQGSELLAARLHRASHYLKAGNGKSATDTWLNPKLLYRIPRDQTSAGLRPLGRLALVDNYRLFVRRLEAELRACCEQTAVPPARAALAPRSLTPRVYIAACLAGNTGSGMFLDVAFAVRERLRGLGHNRAEVVGVFFLPANDATARPAAQSNAYAALTEMSHFSRHPFNARYESGDAQTKAILLHEEAAPFTRCVLFTLPRQTGAGAEAATAQALAIAGDYLYRDLGTPLGKAADELRQRRLLEAGPAPSSPVAFHRVNLTRLTWPRQELLEKGSRRLSRRLVEGWMTKDARPIADDVSRWADEKWDAVGLRPEALIGRLNELCEKMVKQPPERLLTAITGPLGDALAPRPGKPESSAALGPAVAALAELDGLLGVPEECRALNQAPPAIGRLETALADATAKLADACEHRLAAQVVKLIEDPRYRLAGAEEALRRLSAAAERALQSQETLARELNDRAAQLYQRTQKILESPAPPATASNATAWKLSFTRRTPAGAASGAADLLEAMRQYPKARYHALVLHHINRLYLGLRGQLSDQLREVGFCRQRLGELANRLQPATAGGADLEVPARVLLPAGCQNLDEALEQLDQGVTHDDLLALDQQIQALIGQEYSALVNVCMGSSAMVRALAPVMLARAREFLEPRLDGTSVAELLLGRAEGDDAERADQAAGELQELYQRAAPKTGPVRPNLQMALAVIPADVRGQELQQLLRDDLPEVSIVTADRPDEIVFYREHIYPATAGMEQLGPPALEAYRQRLAADPASLHTREDIVEWQPAAACDVAH